MKFYISILLFLIGIKNHGQDTIYYSYNSEKVDKFSEYERYLVESIDSGLKIIKHFNRKGVLIKIERLSRFFGKKQHGLEEQFYSNGEKKLLINYKRGKLDGQTLSFWPDGTLKREDKYKDDMLISGKCYDAYGNEVVHFPLYVNPIYPNGVDALINDINENLVYPIEARKQGLQGLVYIQFVIDKDGNMKQPNIAKSVHQILDEAAIDVLQHLKPFIPGLQDGEPIKVLYTLPINFVLD